MSGKSLIPSNGLPLAYDERGAEQDADITSPNPNGYPLGARPWGSRNDCRHPDSASAVGSELHVNGWKTSPPPAQPVHSRTWTLSYRWYSLCSALFARRIGGVATPFACIFCHHVWRRWKS